MNDKNLEKLKELNFKNVGINWIGRIDSFFISIEDKQDSENELVVSLSLAQNNSRSKLVEYLDNAQKDNKISEYSLEKNKLSAIYRENEDESVENFLKVLLSYIKDIEGKSICDNCDNTEGLSYYTNGSVFSLLCEKCGNETIARFEKDKSKATNYAKGFLFSLIGALAGSVLWIIIGSFGFFASIAGLAISYCAFKGYEIAKGKFTRKGIVINIITIFIAFVFAQYAVLFIEFMKEYENLNLLDFILITPVLFTDLEFVKALLPDIGLGILFVFLGTYRTIINNYKIAKDSDKLTIEKVEM